MMLMLPSFLILSVLPLLGATGVTKSASGTLAWKQESRAAPDQPLKLHIALQQEDGGQAVEERLASVSDPFSPEFRQHLGPEEVTRLSQPAQESVEIVAHWLSQAGLTKNTSLTGNSIYEVHTDVYSAENLLNAKYFVYLDGAQRLIRTERYFLPEEVEQHVDFVSPTTVFPKSQKVMNLNETSQEHLLPSVIPGIAKLLGSCGAKDYVTPSCVRNVYGINYTAEPNRTTFAVYSTEAASFSSADLKAYLSTYNAAAARGDTQYDVLSRSDLGEPSGFAAQTETALDTQTLIGLAWPARGLLYEYGGVFGPHPGLVYDNFVQFLQELIRNETVPSVVSFSESMPENVLEPAYARRLCSMMAQIGARGVTLLFSSGDNGPNGDQPTGTHSRVFEPEFPASCPWVTSVGGTTNLLDETAATKSTLDLGDSIGYTASGGGFSNLFLTPSYQLGAVANYTLKHIPESYNSIPGFNAKGRGIPDVSAFSTNFPVVIDSITIPIGGTSASTPLWAAVVALLNDREASRGRPTLGFINPWLYSLSSGLNDITTGGNNAGSCDKSMGCNLTETLGYNVTEGWDPVTGLGSPLFTDLLVALEKTSARK